MCRLYTKASGGCGRAILSHHDVLAGAVLVPRQVAAGEGYIYVLRSRHHWNYHNMCFTVAKEQPLPPPNHLISLKLKFEFVCLELNC